MSAYVWTKAISAGAILVPFIAWLFGLAPMTATIVWTSIITALVFLTLTGVFLIMDLDQPKRFFYVLLRPHWESWLVKGGYAITVYGLLLTLLGAAYFFNISAVVAPLIWLTAVTAVVVAIYTAFLFAQAKGRDFWQSPMLSIHMLVHSVMAGSAAFLIASLFLDIPAEWIKFLSATLVISLGVNLFTMLMELTMTHPTKDSKKTVTMITKGMYAQKFWTWVVLFGNIIPLLLILFVATSAFLPAVLSFFVLIGIYTTEHIWVEAPQRIPLS